MNAIEVTDLWKIYEIKQSRKGLLGGLQDLIAPQWTKKAAVCGIDFTIQQSETVSYIGPNGSGKSTTIKMLTGILTPTRGNVLVRGIEPSRHRKQNASQIGECLASEPNCGGIWRSENRSICSSIFTEYRQNDFCKTWIVCTICCSFAISIRRRYLSRLLMRVLPVVLFVLLFSGMKMPSSPFYRPH